MNHNITKMNGTWGYTVKVVYPDYTIGTERKNGFLTEEEALLQQQKDQKEYEIALKNIKKKTNMRFTFCEYMEHWFSNIYFAKSGSTISVADYAVHTLIIANCNKDIILSYIDSDYLNSTIERCLKISPSAGFTAKKFLRLALESAYLYGFLKKDFRPNLIPVAENTKSMELPTKEELKRLLVAAKNHEEHYFEILCALLMGLRKGEILALKYSDFDEKTQTVHISRQYAANYVVDKKTGKRKKFMVEKPPKSGSERVLRVPKVIFDELKKRKKLNNIYLKRAKEKGKKKLPKDYVCISCIGQIVSQSTLLLAMKTICNEANVPVISIHTLRHVFVTLLLEGGMPLEQVSQCAGHKSVSTTFNTYAGVIDAREQAKEILEQLDPSYISTEKEAI